MKRKLTLLALSALLSLGAVAKAPKYIFYFIGDGMGVGPVMSAETYNREVLKSDAPLLMMQFPYGGMLQTYSATGPVTDSAAAGTALATGHKTRNSMLGMTPDSVAVNSMAKVLHDNGWGVALVTTVAPDDATPGAFYAHVPSRNRYFEIGKQAAESGYEFIAGSSWRGAYDRSGKSTGLLELMRSHDIDLVTDVDDAVKSKSRRVFLYSENPFTDGNVGFTIDSIPGALTLPDMTAAAIAHMERVSPDRFFMMVEGGNIDHAAHANDGAAVVVEMLNFNSALAHAYEFYQKHPDETVIIVTADHDTGGMSVGNRTSGYSVKTQCVPAQRMSKDEFSSQVKEALKDSGKINSWDEFKEFASSRTGLWQAVPVNESQEAKLKELYDKVFEQRESLADEKTLYSSFNVLANEVYSVLNDNMGFGWTSYRHTGNPVPVYAIGEGMEEFGSFMNNTAVAPRLLKLAGYSF